MINESKVLSATVDFSWFISTHDTMEIYLQRWIAYDKYLLIVLFFRSSTCDLSWLSFFHDICFCLLYLLFSASLISNVQCMIHFV